jgi:fructose-bisphosphate aldolase class I
MQINAEMMNRISEGRGFIAALDQSGGSTPAALRAYGVPDSAYSNDAEMFQKMHEMRVRIMTAPTFTADRILGAILFEGTMDGEVDGVAVPTFLWKQRGVVPFVKIDKGLEAERDGVRLMKPMPQVEALLERAGRLGVFGTKARSVINLASPEGVAAVVAQQFELAEKVAARGLVPIIEPEVLITSPEKAQAEGVLRAELAKRLDALPEGRRVMLKLTLPEQPDHYLPLAGHQCVARVVALSGGYSRDEACARLAKNHGMIASFSRALVGDLRAAMSETEFDASLAAAADQIYRASTVKN